jgi:hypothetical protein
MLDLQLAETKKLVEELEAKLANQNIEIEVQTSGRFQDPSLRIIDHRL